MAQSAARSIAMTVTNATLETYRIKTVRISPETARWADNPPEPWSRKPIRPAPGALIPLWAYLSWEAYLPETQPDTDLVGVLRGSISLNAMAGDLVILFEAQNGRGALCRCEADPAFNVRVQQGAAADPRRAAFNITLMTAR